MLEIAWNAKKTWNIEKKKFLKFYFFQYLKNSYKIKTTFHQYQKLYSTPPWLGAHTCKVSRKYINAFLSYSAKTKRDGRTDRQTGGRCNISRPGPSAPREIIKRQKLWYQVWHNYYTCMCNFWKVSQSSFLWNLTPPWSYNIYDPICPINDS